MLMVKNAKPKNRYSEPNEVLNYYISCIYKGTAFYS